MGANLVAGGATFRVWAPRARAVYVIGEFNGHERDDRSLLNRDATRGEKVASRGWATAMTRARGTGAAAPEWGRPSV